jgi:hypothetical protein
LNPAWVFLHEIAKFGKFGTRGSFIPMVRVLGSALEVNQKIIEHEVNAGRISQPDYYSKEIQRYEQSALGSSRII